MVMERRETAHTNFPKAMRGKRGALAGGIGAVGAAAQRCHRNTLERRMRESALMMMSQY